MEHANGVKLVNLLLVVAEIARRSTFHLQHLLHASLTRGKTTKAIVILVRLVRLSVMMVRDV